MTVTNANRIVLESQPRGRFFEGTLTTGITPLPGTCIKRATAADTWGVGCGASDGTHGLVAVLVEDDLQGRTSSDAYVDSAHFFAYIPAQGERMNMLVANPSGTSDHFTQGDLMMIQATTGKLIANSAGTMVPFIILDTQASFLAADTLIACHFTGN